MNGFSSFPLAELWLLMAMVLVSAPSVHGYANWLKCFVELDDPDEVIMHQSIVPPADQPSSHRAYIEIQPFASRRKDPWFPSTEQDLEDLFPPSIYKNQPSSLLKIRIRTPSDLPQKNVQFVVDATGEGVTFVGPGVMCDGKRAFSLRHDQHVLLQLNRTATGESVSLQQDIELVAGWAAGYEAVKLTSKITLKRTPDNDNNDNRAKAIDGKGNEL